MLARLSYLTGIRKVIAKVKKKIMKEDIIEKYIDKKALENIETGFEGNQEFKEVFYNYLIKYLTEIERDNAIEPEDDSDSLLKEPIIYMKTYAESISQGYSKLWSDERANLEIYLDTKNLALDCYNKVAEQNKELALKDLKTFCKLQNADKIYTDFVIDFATELGYTEKPLEELAKEYSTTYKEQLANGKSEIYAKEYTESLIVDEFDSIYCENYAFIYDESIQKGKSIEYAKLYAEKYGEAVVNILRRAGIKDDEEMLEFVKLKAKAFIDGWEYVIKTELKEKDFFIECYQQAYLNTRFSDDHNEWQTLVECEQIALEKALLDYEKRKEK